MQHTIRDEFQGIVVFIAVLWGVWLVDLLLPIKLTEWGVHPRTLGGLIGIPLMPFLHAGFGHLLGNTIPLVILLVLLAGSRSSSWQVVIEITLLGGALLWCFGRSSATHVGASGLVYGLIAFLIVAGFLEKRLVPLGIAILVGFLYGTTLIFGVLPSVQQHISWDGHLFGAIAGAIVAYANTAQTASQETPFVA
ncbi:MAG: rhomboid family intramembrane serine protease [Pirellulaceae bacterium]|nr:rhomboid family intramembrane serine protease [Pirellulaceae bacterium]